MRVEGGGGRARRRGWITSSFAVVTSPRWLARRPARTWQVLDSSDAIVTTMMIIIASRSVRRSWLRVKTLSWPPSWARSSGTSDGASFVQSVSLLFFFFLAVTASCVCYFDPILSIDQSHLPKIRLLDSSGTETRSKSGGGGARLRVGFSPDETLIRLVHHKQ